MAGALHAAGPPSELAAADGGIGGDGGGADGEGRAQSEERGEEARKATAVLAESARIDRSIAPTVVVASPAATRVMGARSGAGSGAPPPPSGRGGGKRSRPRREVAPLATVLALGVLGVLAAVLLLTTGFGVAHTAVPEMQGLSREGVEARAQRLHVHPAFTASHSVAALGIAIAQAPSPGTHVANGATVHVVLSAGPQWRARTTFSGVDNGQSVPIRILGAKWRVVYRMAYEGSCTLLVVCFGPRAGVNN